MIAQVNGKPWRVHAHPRRCRFLNDVRTARTFNKNGWQAFAGITHVFDRNPPVNLFGNSFGSALYDAIGRAYYEGFNYKF